MPWSAGFLRAKIEKKGDAAFLLTITYSWYGLMNYDVVFLETSLEAAKKRLLTERSHDHIAFYDETGKEQPLH